MINMGRPLFVRQLEQQSSSGSSWIKKGLGAFGLAGLAYGAYEAANGVWGQYDLQKIKRKADYETQKLLYGKITERTSRVRLTFRACTAYAEEASKNARAMYHAYHLQSLSHHPEKCQNYFTSLSKKDQGKILFSLLTGESHFMDTEKLLPILIPKVVQERDVLTRLNAISLGWIFHKSKMQDSWNIRPILQHLTTCMSSENRKRLLLDALFYGDCYHLPLADLMELSKLLPDKKPAISHTPHLPTNDEWNKPQELNDILRYGSIFLAFDKEGFSLNQFEDMADIVLTERFQLYSRHKHKVMDQALLAECIGATLEKYPKKLWELKSAIKLLNQAMLIRVTHLTPETQEAINMLNIQNRIQL